MKALVYIQLKPAVLDPQGKAVAQSLKSLGFNEIVQARQGKIIELDLKGTDVVEGRRRVEDMCEKLLANTVIEDYTVDITA